MVQATLPFIVEIWFMTPRIGSTLGGFHHRVSYWLAVIRPMRDTMGRRVYPQMYAEMTTVGFEEVETYILCH